MRFRRRRQPVAQEQAPGPLEVLLAELDRIGDTHPMATVIAEEIRVNPRAVDRHVAHVVRHVAESAGAWARLDPVVGALTAYEWQAHRVNLAAVATADTRRRQAQDGLERRRQAALRRVEDRVRDRAATKELAALAAVRKEQ